MSEPVYDYYATRIVQDLEDDLYDSKERIQRLRRTNAELASENDRLRDGIASIRDRCTTLAKSAQATNVIGLANLANEMNATAEALTDLLEGDIE